MTAGVIDQNLPHKLRGNGKKMGTILPLRQVLLGQAYVSFVNQCGALEGMVGTFSLKIAAGDSVEFVVDQRHQRVERGLVAVAPANK